MLIIRYNYKYRVLRNSVKVYQCVGCHALHWEPLMKKTENKFIRTHGPPTGPECGLCHSRLTVGGPFYSEPIHDMGFVQAMLDNLDHPETGALKTEKRIRGILTVVSEELQDIPMYYCLDYLASILKLSVPSLIKFRSAILHAGYRVSLSHCHTNSIKTDAPMSVIWDLFQGKHCIFYFIFLRNANLKFRVRKDSVSRQALAETIT